MARLPQTNTTVSRYLRQQKRVVTRMANATPYALSGTSVVAPGLTTVDERLVAGTPGGSRVELDSAGLRKYAADGTTVQVDLTGDVAAFSGLITGSEVVGGVIKTAVTGSRVEVNPDGPPDAPGGAVTFVSGSAQEEIAASMFNTELGVPLGEGAEMSIASAVYTQETGGTSARAILRLWSTYSSDPATQAPFTQAWLLAEHIALDATGVSEGDYMYGGYSGTMRLSAQGGFYIDNADESHSPQHLGGGALVRRIAIVANNAAKASYITAYLSTGNANYPRTITAAKPIFVWQVDAAAGQQFQYTTNGTTWTVIGGGSGGPLFADPNADRLVFWDDSAGAFAPLTASTGLTLTGTDLTVRAATDALMGGVELATSAETVTGTDNTRAVTPAGVKAARNADAPIEGVVTYGSGWRTPTSQPSPPMTLTRVGNEVTLRNGSIENATTLTLVGNGQAPGAFTIPVGFRPGVPVRVPANGNVSYAFTAAAQIIFNADGSGIIQTTNAISAAPAGNASFAASAARWIAAS